MLNARKRVASDPLLPTRQSKYPRVEHTAPGGLATHSGLAARWAQLVRVLSELGPETLRALRLLASTSTSSQNRSPRLRRSISPPPRPGHRPRSRQAHRVTPSDPPPPSRPGITNESHPHEHQARTERAPLSPTFPSDQYSMQSLLNHAHACGSPLQSTSAPGFTSVSHTTSSHYESGDALLADSMQERRNAELLHNALKNGKEHIYARKHKAKVREDVARDREAVMKELYDLKRASGFKSSYEDFKSLINYQARLQHLDDRDTLLPSTSLTDLRLKEDTPGLAHRRSFSNYADVLFLENAKKKLERTLASPTAKPFPTHEWRRQEARKKDEEIERRFRPSLPKSLPPEMDRQVDVLLAKKGVISKVAREQICDKDLSRLLPCQWLNDELINFYGAMILERSEASKENPGANGRKRLLNVHYFNTFFWSKLQGEGYERARLAKWTKKFDIFSKDVILIPVNHNNSHWTGAAINFRRKRIESYDSMNLDRLHVFRGLRHYLDLEHQNKKKKPFDFTGWVNHCPDDTPQQENGYDCGVFTCQFLEALSRGEEVFNFSQRDMAYFRRRMVWEIGHTKLLDVP